MRKVNGKVAGIILLNKNKEVLLYLRDDKLTIPYPNMWAILGGHVENGESTLETLKRELKEEINYNLKKAKFLGCIDDGVGNNLYIYKSGIDKKIEELELNEGQKLGFFNFKKIIELKMPIPLKNFFLENKEEIFGQA